MSRNTMEDMIKIKIVNKGATKKRVNNNHLKNTFPPSDRNNKKKEKIGPRYTLWLLAFISAIFLFFAFSYMFSKADVVIFPRVENIVINENLLASKDSNSSPVSFDLVVISGEESEEVETENKEDIEVKAEGTVVLYNAFSTKSQTLSIDTRLEGSNGKIYKTKKRIIVPGMSSENKEPGKIEVGIYGSSAGEEYNSAPLDFEILGFKNTPKYGKIYARSKGDITGGVEGGFYTITTEQKERVLSGLKNSLQDKLLKKATEQIPTGFVLFRDAIFLSVNSEDVDSFSENSLVPINLKGTLYGFLFNEDKLTKKIAQNVIDDYDDSDVYIANIRDLSFTLIDKENISFSDTKNINFTLEGASKIVWRFDVNEFTRNLVNERKKDFNFILSKYPNVVSSSLVLKPFWRMSFPGNTKNIKVIVNYPK